jgi:hypothetical protein
MSIFGGQSAAFVQQRGQELNSWMMQTMEQDPSVLKSKEFQIFVAFNHDIMKAVLKAKKEAAAAMEAATAAKVPESLPLVEPTLCWDCDGVDGVTANGDVLECSTDEMVGISSAEAMYATADEDQSLQWRISRSDKVF